ncbi:MAG: hypothetical protein ACYTXC_19050 [Nostoc sp.]
MHTNLNYNMDLQKTQLFPFPYWLAASYGRGTLTLEDSLPQRLRFLPSIHLAAKSAYYGGSLLSELGKPGYEICL